MPTGSVVSTVNAHYSPAPPPHRKGACYGSCTRFCVLLSGFWRVAMADTPAPPGGALAGVAHHAESLVEELRQVAVITHRFKAGSQETLNSKMCVRGKRRAAALARPRPRGPGHAGVPTRLPAPPRAHPFPPTHGPVMAQRLCGGPPEGAERPQGHGCRRAEPS